MSNGEDEFPPKGYSNTDTAEVSAVHTLLYLIDDSLVKKNIDKRDKWPNVDGFIEPVESDNKSIPVGRIFVQVKKLPERYIDRPRFQAERSTLSPPTYLNAPYILFAVDVGNDIAYWRHISREFRQSLNMRSDQQSKVISFPDENVVDGKSDQYYSQWVDIIEENSGKNVDYSENERLKERSNPAIGKSKPRFSNIQTFLDTYNSLLDHELGVVKRYTYPNVWKVGYVDAKYTEDIVKYGLYPIRVGENNALIKEIGTDTLANIFEETSVLNVHSVSGNPIDSQPEQYAVGEIEGLTEDLIESRQLSFGGNSFLAREFIYSFVDEYREYMNLPEKNQYHLSELESGFYDQIQLWIDEAVKRLSDEEIADAVSSTVSTTPGFRLDTLNRSFSSVQKDQISSAVESRIQNGDRIGHRYMIGSFKTTPNLFPEALSVLNDNSIKKVARPYNTPNQTPSEGEFIYHWDMYDNEDIKENFQRLYKGYLEAYQAVVTENFPEIQSELLDIYDEPLSIFSLELEDGPNGEPAYRRFGLQPVVRNHGHEGIHVLPADSDIVEQLNQTWQRGGAETTTYKHTDYSVPSYTYGDAHFVFEDTPMLDHIYNTLDRRLTEYFNSKRQDI